MEFNAKNARSIAFRTMLLGEYPQTVKADEVSILGEIDARGYYLGSDGAYYVRSLANMYESHSAYTFSTGEQIKNGELYYFKLEPIRWRILIENGDKAFLLCDSILASHCYDPTSNKYSRSEIRAWLNGEFYHTAFDEVQKSRIRTTTVDNSARTTREKWNLRASRSTKDKIFLLSYQEWLSEEYQFNSDLLAYDEARRIQTSDYARATGTLICTNEWDYGFGCWWLRSPSRDRKRVACMGAYDGSCGRAGVGQRFGVAPAMWIQL